MLFPPSCSPTAGEQRAARARCEDRPQRARGAGQAALPRALRQLPQPRRGQRPGGHRARPRRDRRGRPRQRVRNAIRIGGTGQKRMPAGLLQGEDAEDVASYVSEGRRAVTGADPPRYLRRLSVRRLGWRVSMPPSIQPKPPKGAWGNQRPRGRGRIAAILRGVAQTLSARARQLTPQAYRKRADADTPVPARCGRMTSDMSAARLHLGRVDRARRPSRDGAGPSRSPRPPRAARGAASRRTATRSRPVRTASPVGGPARPLPRLHGGRHRPTRRRSRPSCSALFLGGSWPPATA